MHVHVWAQRWKGIYLSWWVSTQRISLLWQPPWNWQSHTDIFLQRVRQQSVCRYFNVRCSWSVIRAQPRVVVRCMVWFLLPVNQTVWRKRKTSERRSEATSYRNNTHNFRTTHKGTWVNYNHILFAMAILLAGIELKVPNLHLYRIAH